MAFKFQCANEADPYEAELEELGRTHTGNEDDRKWVWIVGGIVVAVIVIGLLITIVRLTGKVRRRLWD